MTRLRRLAGVTVTLVVLIAGCTPSPSAPPSSRSSADGSPPVGSFTPNGPQPVSGGTLRVLGTSDTDYLDPNISYYPLGYAYFRQFARQLYSWPAVAGQTATVVPDLATAMPDVDATGTIYTVTIRRGAEWNTSPPRQVTAADVVRGVEMTCNPAQAFGGLPEFEALIAGMQQFCRRFAAVHPQPGDIDAFLQRNVLPGVTVGSDPQQVMFQLNHPANDFVDMLAMPAFSPRPRELQRFLPGSPEEAQQTVSDGPYQVVDYRPGRRIVFGRNPSWRAETDPVRHAYVDRIVIGMTSDPVDAIRTLESGRGPGDLAWFGVFGDQLKALIKAHDPRLQVDPEVETDPFLVFNTVSPNNHGALQNPNVRRAISYAIDRQKLARIAGAVTPASLLTHVLPPGVLGSEPFDPYPYDPGKAEAMLQAAHAAHLKLTVLYRPTAATQINVLRELQRELGRVDVRLKGFVSNEEFPTRYLEDPGSARQGVWDVALTGWVADWPGNAASGFFRSLFDGRVLPPESYDSGLYDNPAVSALIDRAEAAPIDEAPDLWHQADEMVMADAPIYPLVQPSIAFYVPDRVHNAVFLPALGEFDLTNVWLDRTSTGQG
jgi:peptide/nickel transport system substrate-binding protein